MVFDITTLNYWHTIFQRPGVIVSEGPGISISPQEPPQTSSPLVNITYFIDKQNSITFYYFL